MMEVVVRGREVEQVPGQCVREEEEFTFRPYIYTPQGTSPLSLFDEHDQEIALSRQDVRSFGHGDGGGSGAILLPSKTESGEGVAFYSP